MNDADRKAFEAALVNRCKTVVTVPQDFEAGWQACCEWRDSQSDRWLDMSIQWHGDTPKKGEHEWTVSQLSAAQINQQLVEALDKLHTVVIAKNRAGAD